MSEIYGEVFLVSACPYSVTDNQNIRNYYDHREVIIRGDTVEAEDPGLFVQIWCSSNECHDWQSHGICAGIDIVNDFPEFIPISALEGLREGDMFTLVYREHTFKLTCCQLGHKYSRLGSFQRALKTITKSYRSE